MRMGKRWWGSLVAYIIQNMGEFFLCLGSAKDMNAGWETNQRGGMFLGFCWLGCAVVLSQTFSLLFPRPAYHITSPPAR